MKNVFFRTLHTNYVVRDISSLLFSSLHIRLSCLNLFNLLTTVETILLKKLFGNFEIGTALLDRHHKDSSNDSFEIGIIIRIDTVSLYFHVFFDEQS